jgi:uncharacterized membrane protein
LSDRNLRAFAALIAVAGLGVAAYLTWAHYADTQVVCVAGGGCEKVQQSEYSEVAGIPVALLGLLSYSAILAFILWDSPTARLGAATLALVGVLFAAYLVVLQLFVIDATCIWCMVNDVLIAPTLAIVTVLRLRHGS